MKNIHQSKISTRVIHQGEPKPTIHGAITLPIFQSSTFEFRGEYGGENRGENGGDSDYNSIRYTRLNNTPNHLCLHEKLASIENAESAVVTASGMAAITTSLLHCLESGETLLAQEGLYGGTHHFLTHEFKRFNRSVRFFSLDQIDTLDTLLDSSVRAIYVESTSNPLLRIPNLPAVTQFAKKHGLTSLIDNTFPSPINCNPIDYGFDIVLHSATKYLNGHTDIIAGCVAGSRERISGITKLLNHLGGCLDPHAAFLLNRGLKTLPLRVKQQNDSALKLAKALQGNPHLHKVIFPGLADHPDHELAKKLLRGFGAIVSIEFAGTPSEADHFISRLKLAYCAPSLGGVETLVTRPSTTSHSGVSIEDRKKMGIADTLIRISVGLEDSEDLIADFMHALG